MARKYASVTSSLSSELDIYLDKTDTEGKDEETLKEDYMRLRRLGAFDAYVVGMRIRDERKKSGLTQQEVADALGVSVITVNRWERGRVDLTLRDAHRLMMLFRRIPGNRADDEQANLNDITWTPMEYMIA